MLYPASSLSAGAEFMATSVMLESPDSVVTGAQLPTPLALMRAMHKTRIKAPAPSSLVGLGSAVMEMVLPKPPLTKAAMTLFAFDNTTDLNSVERDFGFMPMSFTRYLDENGV